MKLKPPSEYAECCHLLEWASYQRWGGHRLSDLLIMIPNGAYLGANPRTRAITMSKLKAAGLKPGVFDYLLAVPNWTDQYAGLWIEMKRQRLGSTSPEQGSFHTLVSQLGYCAIVCKGWVDASQHITAYLADIDLPLQETTARIGPDRRIPCEVG
jgi:hypothetical protein